MDIVPKNGCGILSAASADSYSDYGQFAISQSGLGHIMYSAMTTRSTIDFSAKPIEDGVVNSPPNREKHSKAMCSPSPLKQQQQSMSPTVFPSTNVFAPRKLYNEAIAMPIPSEV